MIRFLVHNVIAHPLMGVLSVLYDLSWKLHNFTAGDLDDLIEYDPLTVEDDGA